MIDNWMVEVSMVVVEIVMVHNDDRHVVAVEERRLIIAVVSVRAVRCCRCCHCRVGLRRSYNSILVVLHLSVCSGRGWGFVST